jgi:ADP-ribosylglycohydrolase
MRCIGIPLLAFRDSAVLTDLARRQSWVTHRNPTSVAACIAFSLMVSRVLMGMSPKRAWSHAKLELESHHSPSDSAMREILAIEPSRPDYELEMKGREGWVALSLRVALWASIEAENFEDGIQKAISVGGDTDTYAAIAGGILGAHVGLEGIPLQWRALLQGRAIMESLADGLFGLAHPEFDRR